jgi:hypothetical protein
VEDFVKGGNVERYFEGRWQQSTVATARGEIVGVAVLEGTLLDLVWSAERWKITSRGSKNSSCERPCRRERHSGHVVVVGLSVRKPLSQTRTALSQRSSGG